MNAPTPQLLHRRAIFIASPLLTGAFTAVCFSGGTGLALFFGGIIAITLTVPIMVSAVDRWIDAASVTAFSMAGVAGVWIIPVAGGHVLIEQWLGCAGIALAFAASLASLTTLLRRVRFSNAASSALTIVVALAWLTWPIWLSPAIEGHQTLVDCLIPAHPLLAINGQLLHMGIWTERPMMYRWTALNQDVSYAMPTNPWWCITVHVLIGLAYVPVFSRTGIPAGRDGWVGSIRSGRNATRSSTR